MSEALRAVREDPSLKEAYFTTPLALHTAGMPNKFRKGNHKGKDKTPGQEIPPPPAPHQNGRGTGKGKGKKGKGQVVLANGKQLALVSATPDGRQLCYAYNHQGCTDPKCTRVHACPVAGCFAEHPASQHEDSSMQKVTSANHFVDQCLKATVFAAEAGNFFMWEAPEHLGRTADGLVPSSIWAWPELLDCIPRFAATTFVHYLCEFGADMAKPTRYLSNLPFFRHSPRPFNGMPVLDADQRYVGPLPASCPHGGHSPSTGKSQATQKWNLPRAHGWPLQLCQFMVAAIDFSLQADGEPPRESTTATPGSSFATGAYRKGGLVGLRHHSTVLPKSTQVLTRYLQQVAPGFRASAIAIFDDVRTGVHRDARNAHYPNTVVPLSDFEDGQIWLEQQGGDVWETTPEGRRPGVLLEVCKGPVSFDAWRSYHATRSWKGRRVVMVAYMTDKLGNVEAADLAHLKALGFKIPLDSDASNGETSEVLDTAEGLSTGDTAPPVPFRPEACGNRGNPIRVEWEGQEADMTDGFGLCSPARWRPMDRGHRLGPAATAHAQSMYRMLTNFISEHVPDPRRFCLSLLSGKVESSPFAGEKLEALRKQWAEVLGAENNPDVLEIPDAQPFLLRALSLSAERLEDPDWQILTEGVDCAMQEIPLAATADVSAAHRLVLHRKSDWALMSCRAEQGLYGIIGRVVTRCLLQHAFYHFAYVDDVRPTFYGKRMFINFLVWLILQELIGVPFAYHKFKGKTLVAFIGYELDYGARLVGLSEARGAWVCNWVDEARKARFVVSVRKFAEFLGRLGFVSRVVYWIKPHLAPLYAWSAAASKSHVAKMPDTVILTLLYLEATLKDINFKVAPGRQREETGHLFHTDAKCDDGYVVLGGWDSSQDLSVAPWFSIVVKPADAPYLFDEDGKSQWASASAELLATLAALWIFGHLKESSSQRRLPVAIAGATDNQSNEKLLRKQSTTKWPLMLINMQLSHLLRKACLRLSLTWKPRDENKLADALTNQDFISFSSEHRLDVSFSELPLELLNQLWSSKSDFDASRKALQSASSFQPRVPKRKREGTPW
ncbi:mettl24 [Symbiodinium sp. CCMP2592]|nr:mettl24 [Symbiodinium sp. CCMP2592]CAE7235581.1 mettl24 [Symbiodinium sp. CCMP2592]